MVAVGRAGRYPRANEREFGPFPVPTIAAPRNGAEVNASHDRAGGWLPGRQGIESAGAVK